VIQLGVKYCTINILIELEVPKTLDCLRSMCLSKTCRKVRVGKHLSDNFRNQNGLKQGDDLSPLLLEGPGIPGVTEIKWDTSAAGLC
jgi:hypothetical protein